MTKPMHERLEFLRVTRLTRILFQPLPKGGIQRLMLRTRHLPRLLNQIFVCAQSYVFHAKIVYTIFVHTTTVITVSVSL